MPRGGARPGAGRPKGSIARRKIGLEAQAITDEGGVETPAELPAADLPTGKHAVSRLVSGKSTSLESLEQLRKIAREFMSRATAMKKLQKTDPDAFDEDAYTELRLAAARVFTSILPYENARQAPQKPLPPAPIDLANATDAQLSQLEQLLAAIANSRGNRGREGSSTH
jgi:hypothetical protein